MALEPVAEDGAKIARQLIDKIVSVGMDGAGPFKSAREVADEHRAQYSDVDVAIDRVIRTHMRMVAATGFATGLPGLWALPVTLPADVTVFYSLCARCVAAVADLRGHDTDSDEVRSVILLSLIGAQGVALAAEVGAKLGNKAAFAALQKLPGKVLIEINKKVGFRLLTKFGTKGVINLGKAVPVVGGGVGAAVNAGGMKTAGRYAKHNFPKT